MCVLQLSMCSFQSASLLAMRLCDTFGCIAAGAEAVSLADESISHCELVHIQAG